MNGRTTGTAPKSGGNGLLWLVGIVGCGIVLANASKCSPTKPASDKAQVASSDPTIKTLSAAVAAQTPPPMQPLSTKAVAKGFTNVRMAITAEGLSGAMIYSQNCYDALSHAFDWRLLDTCGGADLKATSTIPEDEAPGLEKEIAYFQSETAAARYLGAATGAGASPSDADERLATLQTRIASRRPGDEETIETQPPADEAGRSQLEGVIENL